MIQTSMDPESLPPAAALEPLSLLEPPPHAAIARAAASAVPAAIHLLFIEPPRIPRFPAWDDSQGAVLVRRRSKYAPAAGRSGGRL
jgi:hypothetical protein